MTALFGQIDCPGIKARLSPPRKVGPALVVCQGLLAGLQIVDSGPLGDKRLPLQLKSVTLLKKPEAHGQGNRDDTGGPDADFA